MNFTKIFDIAVQAQMGTSAFVILGQQGPMKDACAHTPRKGSQSQGSPDSPHESPRASRSGGRECTRVHRAAGLRASTAQAARLSRRVARVALRGGHGLRPARGEGAACCCSSEDARRVMTAVLANYETDGRTQCYTYMRSFLSVSRSSEMRQAP